VLSKALAKAPPDRYASAAQFIDALTSADRIADDVESGLRETVATVVRSPKRDQAAPAVPADASGNTSGRRRVWAAVALIAIAFAAAIGVRLAVARRTGSTPTQTAPSPPSAIAPATAPATATPPPATPPQPMPPQTPRPRSEPAAATPPPPTAPAEPASPAALTLRYDGSYRIGPNPGGRYTHFVFKADGSCTMIAVRFPAIPRRVLDDAPGPSCAYRIGGRGAAIMLTRADGNVERAAAFTAPDGTVMIRRQPAQFVPFVVR
jgi:hypothetical protein